MASALPDPAAFAFRTGLVREPAPELADEAVTVLGELLADRGEVASARLLRHRRTRLAEGADTLATELALVLEAPPVDEPEAPELYIDLCVAVLRALGDGGFVDNVSIPTRRAIPVTRDYGVCVFEREPE